MIIHYRNANALLFEKTNSISVRPNSWRCIHITLANKQEGYNQVLLAYFIIKGLMEVLAEDDGYIYLCEDGDIFILFQGALRPIMTKLSNHFADLDFDYNEKQSDDGVFTIYDMSTDWEDFMGVCYHRSANTENSNETINPKLYHYAGKAIEEAMSDA